MLILTRRIGEALRIGDHIRIEVLSHQGRQIKLGIHAPKSIEVHRQEVFDRLQQERTAAHPTESAAAE